MPSFIKRLWASIRSAVMRIGLRLGITRALGTGLPQIITSLISSSQSLTEGDLLSSLPASLTDTASYESSEGNITSAVLQVNGETQPGSYALAPGDVVRVLVSDDAGTTPRPFSVGRAAYIAPTAAGGLPDISLFVGDDINVDLSGDFTGNDLTHSLAPSSASLSDVGLELSESGQLTGEAIAALPTSVIVIRATNPDGAFVDSAFNIDVTLPEITVDTPPAMGVLANGDLVSSEDGADGEYSSNVPGETISISVSYERDDNGFSQVTGAVSVGETVRKRVDVTGSEGTTATVFSAAIEVLDAPPIPRVLSVSAGDLSGANLPITLDVDGAPDVTYAIGDFALVGDGSPLLNRNLAAGGENIIDHPIASAGSWIPGGGGVQSSDQTLNALGLFPGVQFTSAGAVWNRLNTTGNVEQRTDPEDPLIQYVVAFVYGPSTSGRARLALRNNPAATETTLRGPLGDMSVVNNGTAGDVSILAQENDGTVYVCWVLFTPNFTGQCSFGIGPDQANSNIIIHGISGGPGTEPISFIPETAPATRPDAVVSGTFPAATDGIVDVALPNGFSGDLSVLATSPENTVVVSDGPFSANTATPVAANPPSLPIIIHEAAQNRFRVVDQGAMTNTETLRFEWFIDGNLVPGSPELTAPDAAANAGDTIRLDLYYVNANGESLQQSNELVFGGRDFSDIHQVITDINAGTITGGLAVGGDSTRFRETTRMMQHYYPTQLGKIHPTGMALVNNSFGGQSAQDWSADVDNANIGQLDGQITGTGAGWIYELSYGLNDYTANTPEVKAAMKAGLETGLNRLHSLYPDMEIFLVTPVFNENADRGAMTQEVYAELSAERTLPLVDAYSTMQPVWDAATDQIFYEDGPHPSSQGSARLIHIIFNEIVPPSLYSVVTIDNMHRNPGDGVPAEPLTQAEIVAGLTLSLALVNENPVVAAPDANNLTLNSASLTALPGGGLRIDMDADYDGDGTVRIHLAPTTNDTVPTQSQMDAASGNVIEKRDFLFTSDNQEVTVSFTTAPAEGDDIAIQLREVGTDVVTAILMLEVPAPIAVSGITVAAIPASPVVEEATASPAVWQFNRAASGPGIIMFGGFRFRGSQSAHLINGVTYGGVAASSFEVVLSPLEPRLYIGVARFANMASGLQNLEVLQTSGEQMQNFHGAQLFETSAIPANLNALETTSLAGVGTMSLNLGALAAGGGVVAAGISQNTPAGATLTGVSKAGEVQLGSNNFSTAFLSDLSAAQDPFTATLTLDNADGSSSGLFVALPINPA